MRHVQADTAQGLASVPSGGPIHGHGSGLLQRQISSHYAARRMSVGVRSPSSPTGGSVGAQGEAQQVELAGAHLCLTITMLACPNLH